MLSNVKHSLKRSNVIFPDRQEIQIDIRMVRWLKVVFGSKRCGG